MHRQATCLQWLPPPAFLRASCWGAALRPVACGVPRFDAAGCSTAPSVDDTPASKPAVCAQIDNPRQEDVECLCKLLRTIGKTLEDSQVRLRNPDAFSQDRLSLLRTIGKRLRTLSTTSWHLPLLCCWAAAPWWEMSQSCWEKVSLFRAALCTALLQLVAAPPRVHCVSSLPAHCLSA